jgi:molybdopterin biosynthesis enzyme
VAQLVDGRLRAARSGHEREPVELAVVGTISAGSVPPRALGAGESMRIFTGAPLPRAPTPSSRRRTLRPTAGA